MKKAYFSTPIYYVNGSPHIGHFYTSLVTDVLARIHVMMGFDVKLLTGTDEHGLKVQRKAENLNKRPIELCDENSKSFQDLISFASLCFSYEKFDANENFYQINQDSFFEEKSFIRTTQMKHKNFVRDIWIKLLKNNWIYKGKYKGWYCVAEEAYFEEKELIDGKTPTGYDVEWREEEVYFFKLSKFQKILFDLFSNNDFISPNSVKQEILSFIKGGKEFHEGYLKDLAISREKANGFFWGIDVPNDDNHVIYVWLDALFNYISALDEKEYKTFFCKNENSIGITHIVGKDITRFHTIFWFAFLLGLKYTETEIENNTQIDINILPNKVFGHGWWIANNQKISKTFGNIINPYEEIAYLQDKNIELETAKDYFKFSLLYMIPLGNDGNYSREAMQDAINSQVVNNVGNLYIRSIKILQKKLGDSEYCIINGDLKFFKAHFNSELTSEIENLIKDFKIKEIIDKTLIISNKFNAYIAEKEPWKLTDLNEICSILLVVLEGVKSICILLRPFLPYTMDSLLSQLNVHISKRNFEDVNKLFLNINDLKNAKVEILTPKLV